MLVLMVSAAFLKSDVLQVQRGDIKDGTNRVYVVEDNVTKWIALWEANQTEFYSIKRTSNGILSLYRGTDLVNDNSFPITGWKCKPGSKILVKLGF